MIKQGALLLSLVVLSGCATSDMALQEPINAKDISNVFIEIKRQLYAYRSKAAKLKDRQLSTDTGNEWQTRAFRCGSGDAVITVKSLTVTLSTTNTSEQGLNAKGTLPVAVPISLAAAASFGQTNSQELTLTLYPASQNGGDPNDDRPAPIADQLLAVRDAMIISGTMGGDCIKTGGADAKNTYLLGIQITKSQSGEIGVGLAPVNLGLSGSNKSVTGNQIVVAFQGKGTSYFMTTFDKAKLE